MPTCAFVQITMTTNYLLVKKLVKWFRNVYKLIFLICLAKATLMQAEMTKDNKSSSIPYYVVNNWLIRWPILTDPSGVTDLAVVTDSSVVTDPSVVIDPSVVTDLFVVTDIYVVTDLSVVTDPCELLTLWVTDPSESLTPLLSLMCSWYRSRMSMSRVRSRFCANVGVFRVAFSPLITDLTQDPWVITEENLL